ncbi:MAG: OmpA family protein [Acidobacteria bacterium]|nr:OmpA family protein [Acidobacteriota bacterium]
MRERRLPLLLGSVVVLLTAGGCANRPPLLNCIADQTSLIEGESTTIQSNATDPDRNDQLTFAWTADQGRLVAQNGSAVFDSTSLSAGTYTVSLEVSDEKQHVAICEVDLTVGKNAMAPTVSCEPSNMLVTEGQSRRIQVRASDPNNDPLTYSWTVDGRAVTNNQSSFEFGTINRTVGNHRVGVTVRDIDGLTANCEFRVTIDPRPNTAPSVALTLDKTDVYADDTVGANAQASDPENDPMTYAWTLDSQRRPESSSRIQINTRGLAGGRHSVVVTVEDDRGASASDTKTFSVSEKIVIHMEGNLPNNVAKAQLDEIALKMRQNPQLRATLTGHTDDRGSEEINERVGLRRADAVRSYLVREQNLDEGRIETQSAGETQPIADNATPQGQSDNRRVEVELFVP